MTSVVVVSKKILTFRGVNKECLQTVFFGQRKADLFTVVLGEGDGVALWFSQLLLPFHLNARSKMNMSEDLAFVRYVGIAPHIDSGDNVLSCLCLRWAADNEIYHKDSEGVPTAGVFKVEEWYGVVCFISISSVHHILTPNNC